MIIGGREQPATWDGESVLDASGRPHRMEDVVWLPPVRPGKMIGLALNFADHADELGLKKPEVPAIFIKAPNTLLGHRGSIVYPEGVEYMHYEAELAVVIGRACRKVRAADAWDVVGGYTVANDVTVRDFVTNMFRPPVKPKGFDTFGPLGPWVVSTDEVGDPTRLEISTRVNGDLRQHGNTRDLIFGIPDIIEYLTAFMTLEPDDVILTGTPKGVSHIHPGDVVRCEVEGIGVLENTVVAEAGETRA
ncbi:MAG TPA: fumarylacetoacetate hydrolase family protein [Deinococcales bacterium]|nr:fumarylacetoacetate hydrolase family protein [Deinococcales bacterium]